MTERQQLEAWQPERKHSPNGIYHVLEPEFIETRTPVGNGYGNYFRVEWNFVGFAESMEDAKTRHRAPILAWVEPTDEEWIPLNHLKKGAK